MAFALRVEVCHGATQAQRLCVFEPDPLSNNGGPRVMTGARFVVTVTAPNTDSSGITTRGSDSGGATAISPLVRFLRLGFGGWEGPEPARPAPIFRLSAFRRRFRSSLFWILASPASTSSVGDAV